MNLFWPGIFDSDIHFKNCFYAFPLDTVTLSDVVTRVVADHTWP